MVLSVADPDPYVFGLPDSVRYGTVPTDPWIRIRSKMSGILKTGPYVQYLDVISPKLEFS